MSTSIKYEAEPKTFEESYRDGDFPTDPSENRVVAWILIKVGTVRKIREDIDKSAVTWPDVRDIIQKRDDIIAFIEDLAKEYDQVMACVNQFAKDYASLAVLISPYAYLAFRAWVLANDGVRNEFDRAIYHLTGFKLLPPVS